MRWVTGIRRAGTTATAAPEVRRCDPGGRIGAVTLPGMTSTYPSSPSGSSGPISVTSPVRISAGTAVKIGFFGALGATLFSLVLTLIGVLVVIVLALLGVGVGSLFPLPR